MPAWLLLALWFVAAKPVPPPAAPVPGLVDVVVATREGKSGGVAVLWLSNRSGTHGRAIESSLDHGISVVVGAGESEPRLLGPGLQGPRDEGAEAAAGSAGATARLLGWMKPMQHAEAAIAGLVRSDGLAVWQGPACAGCEVHRSDQAWVLTRGLPEGTAATVGRRIAATREPGVRELLALTRDVGQLWPTRVGLRSAYVVALRHDRAREELIVADDDRGRAESSLQRLHLRHLGDLELDFQLARARRFLAMADDVRAPHAIAMAIWAARSALQYAPKEPLWRAKLALALALQPGIDDGALRELDRALALAPTMPEIRLVAAEVLSLRGDVAGARFQLATALRLSPNDPTIVAALARLGEE